MIKNVARKYFFKTTRQSQLRGESFVRITTDEVNTDMNLAANYVTPIK